MRIGASVKPGANEILFTRDVGGDENFAGYMLDLATGRARLITEAGTRNEGFIWSDDGERIRIHLYFLRERERGWKADVHTTHYRALRRADFSAALTRTGFTDVRWWFPEETGYYQPIVTARASAR